MALDWNAPAFLLPKQQDPAVNTIRATLSASPEGQAFYRKIDIPATDLSTSPLRIATTLTDLWQKIVQFEANRDYRPEIIAAYVAQARADALQAFDREAADDQKRYDAITAAAAAAIHPTMPKDPAAAALFEAQLSRAWQRYQRILDAADHEEVLAVAREMIETAAKADDAAAVEAFRQELPAYGRSRHILITQEYVDGALVPFLTPAGRAATQALQALATGWARIQSALWIARRYASDTTGERINNLPGWSAEISLVKEIALEP